MMLKAAATTLCGTALLPLLIGCGAKEVVDVPCSQSVWYPAAVAEARKVLPNGSAATTSGEQCWEGGGGFLLTSVSEADKNIGTPPLVEAAQRNGWDEDGYPECRVKTINGESTFMAIVGHDPGDPRFAVAISTPPDLCPGMD